MACQLEYYFIQGPLGCLLPLWGVCVCEREETASVNDISIHHFWSDIIAHTDPDKICSPYAFSVPILEENLFNSAKKK